MKRSLDALREYALSCVDDIEFTWNGVHGLIVPYSPQKYVLCFGGPEDAGREYHNVGEMLSAPCFEGKSLSDICEELDFLR